MYADPATLALMIPLLALAIPIVAILVKPMTEAGKRRERERARQMYERLALEKLDVIKTAIAMGMGGNDLTELDRRLERLIGTDKLQTLFDPQPGTPVAAPELLHAELTEELQRVRDERSKQRS